MTRLFGTDGVRGRANQLLTPELAMSLAQSASVVLGFNDIEGSRKPVAVVAKDPRISGSFISAAIEAGLSASGVEVYDAGTLPTPAAAYLVADLEADFGVMISASHNPAPDNGIKFLARGGQKLDDALEDAIESRMQLEPLRPQGGDVGRVYRFADAEDRYVMHLLQTLPNRLDGLKIVIDAAHGAASGCSPDAFRAAGAEVVVIGASPDGLNINEGSGSTHLEMLQKAVVEHGADMGVAHDGDADRCLTVDHEGNVIDGDKEMAILAIAMHEAGKLKDDTLVVTVMSNLGLKLAMKEHGINVVETAVGDRYVLEEMRKNGYSLGGEQSGHVIMQEFATTGDGVLTGLHLAARVAATGKSLKELGDAVTVLPQVLINVRGVEKAGVGSSEQIQEAVAQAEERLGDTGRVLLRPSGTEPVVRVMVEAATEEQATDEARRLAQTVQTALPLG